MLKWTITLANAGANPRDMVERARLRFTDTGIKIATVFAGQDGVDRVLDYLEKSCA